MFRLLYCSFCHRSESEVTKLVAGPRILFIGPRVYICDRCVAASLEIMEQASPSPTHV
jgi:ATP-dependent protease Clp ATPase subunit